MKAVAWVTFFDIVSDRIFVLVIGIALFVGGLGFLASELMVIDPGRVIIDMGLAACGLSSALLAVIFGPGIIAQEAERRTWDLAFACRMRPLSFLAAKLGGLGAVISIHHVSLGFLLGLCIWGFGLSCSWVALGTSLLLLWVQACVIASYGIFFATIMTRSLASMATVAVFFLGHAHQELERFFGWPSKLVAHFSSYALDGSLFYHGLPCTGGLFFVLVQACAIVLFLTSLASWTVRRKF